MSDPADPACPCCRAASVRPASLSRPSGLSRRSFQRGLFAAAIAPLACPAAPPDSVVEPAMSLIVPPSSPVGSPRTVALTLDACGGATDPRILSVLTGQSIAATIFVTGLWLRGNAAALATLRARPDLFSIQNHGERHLPPVLGSRRVYGLPVAGTLDAVRAEVTRGADLITEATGVPPRWYRGAAGLYSQSALEAIEAMGARIAAYSLNADEGASLPAATVARRIGAAHSGDVIAAHINQPHRPSGQGVAEGIAALRAAGVVFVTLDALPVTPLTCRVHGAAAHVVA